ncbi:MAG: T9SS type A sorting domain-containing protein [Bacteroidota bacterium]
MYLPEFIFRKKYKFDFLSHGIKVILFTSFIFQLQPVKAQWGSNNKLNAIAGINAIPVIGGTTPAQAVNDNATVFPFTSVTVTDADLSQVQTVSVSLDIAEKGSFTTLNGFVDAGNGVYTFSGKASRVQSAIRGLEFTPSANRVSPNDTETTNFTISMNDGFVTVIDNNTSVVSISINNAPLLSGDAFILNVTGYTVPSSGTLINNIINGFTYIDEDITPLLGIAVIATAGNGIWEYSTNGVVWNNIGVVTEREALLLDATTQLRYSPDGINTEVAVLNFKAWDQTTDIASTNEIKQSADATINGESTSFSSGSGAANNIVIDPVPTVTTIEITGTTPTNETTVDYKVTFSENVAGVDINDFSLVANAPSGRPLGRPAGVAGIVPVNGVISAVIGSGNIYYVTVSNITGSGDLGLELISSGTGIIDEAGNEVTNGFIGGGIYTIIQLLPVTWQNFAAKEEQDIYTWTWTLSNTENVGWYVPQYSSDGINFIDAGKVMPAYNTNSYSFSKKLPVTGTSFLRVQQIDKSGKMAYSEIRKINNSATTGLSFYPNPAKSTIFLKCRFSDSDIITTIITNSSGRILKQQKNTAAASIKVSLVGLPRGTYYIYCTDGKQHKTVTQKLLKIAE